MKSIQVGFTAGELDPVLLGRSDQELYYKGASKLRNVAVNPQGHVSRRDGSKYVDILPQDEYFKLIDFVFNDFEKYLLIIVNKKVRIYRDDILVTELVIESLEPTIIKKLKWVQEADTLLLFHPEKPTIKITRLSNTNWQSELLEYKNIPYFAFNGVNVTNPNGTLTIQNVSGRNVVFDSQYDTFSVGSVGQFIYGGKGGVARIVKFTNPKKVVCNIIVDFPSKDVLAQGNWEYETGYEKVWSSKRGYPSCGVFHHNRLWVASSYASPRGLWASKVNNFFDFDEGDSDDSDAINLTIQGTNNTIKSLVSGRDLLIFTASGEYYIGTDTGKPVTPNTPPLANRTTSHGTGDVLPVMVGGVFMFVESKGKVVREFVYNDLERNYNAKNASILSSHLIRQPVDIAVRQSTDISPADYLYLVNSDGTIAVLNTAKDQDLLAWSLWETKGKYKNICNLGDKIYTIVERSGQYFLEYFSNKHILDCSLIKTSAPSKTFSGFNHLKQQEVEIKTDDFHGGYKVVNENGKLIFDRQFSRVEAGFTFLAKTTTLPVRVLEQPQLLSDWVRVTNTSIYLYKTTNLVVKTNNKVYKPSFRRFGSNLLDKPIEAFSGWKKIFLSGISKDIQIEYSQEHSAEFQILSLVIEVK